MDMMELQRCITTPMIRFKHIYSLTRFRYVWLLILALLLGLAPAYHSIQARDMLPPLVFVARAHLATQDAVFNNERGPAGQLTSGLDKFAPGSRLVIREPEGNMRVLLDTSKPAGDALNPAGLRDLQSPDVSFDATRIIFAGTTGPTLFVDRKDMPAHYSWRIYEIGIDGSGLRQLSVSDRTITIPGADASDSLGNAQAYSFYDDLFPAYLADGRIVFSSSRYPSRSHYDGRPTFNLYMMAGDGSALHRITTERGGALHPTPLPDGRIMWSRWWVNFNQPSETGIYNRADNKAGTELARDESGMTLVDATGQTVTGHRLSDNTLVYSKTVDLFDPARGRLADGSKIRSAPNTWHLMTVNTDGSDMRRFAWTPRYATSLLSDDGQDTFNAAQPALVVSGTEQLVAFTTQRDGTMAHSTLNTGIRVARLGIEQAYRNVTESIAGYRWGDSAAAPTPPFALHPAGLPNGSILFSQTLSDSHAPQDGSYNFTQNGKQFTLPLQAAPLRYTLWTIQPDGSRAEQITLNDDLGSADAMDAKPIVVRPLGNGSGQWRAQTDTYTAPISDDPVQGNVPQGLRTADGQSAYPWSTRTTSQIALTTLHNPNVYANAPLALPYINNSPPVGSVAFADIYIDANQFTGVRGGSAPALDNETRAIKWTTVPVDAQGAFTAQVPADTPAFIVLRDRNGHVVRAGNRSSIAIAQGNAPGRPGETVRCVGCHMGHTSGSLDGVPLTKFGWSNVAPSAVATATSEWTNGNNSDYNGKASHLNDRRNYVASTVTGSVDAYQDRTPPWIAANNQSLGQSVQLDWSLPIAVRDVRLIGAEPNQDGFSADYQVSGELRFFLAGQEIVAARQSVNAVASLTQGGTTIHLSRVLAADRVTFSITRVVGQRNGSAAPAALAEVEVIGKGATPAALSSDSFVIHLPLVVR